MVAVKNVPDNGFRNSHSEIAIGVIFLFLGTIEDRAVYYNMVIMFFYLFPIPVISDEADIKLRGYINRFC